MEEEKKRKACDELNILLARDYKFSEAEDRYYQELQDILDKSNRERQQLTKNFLAIQKLNDILPQEYQIPEVEEFCKYSFFQGLMEEIESLRMRVDYAVNYKEPKFYCVECGEDANYVPQLCFACFDR